MQRKEEIKGLQKTEKESESETGTIVEVMEVRATIELGDYELFTDDAKVDIYHARYSQRCDYLMEPD